MSGVQQSKRDLNPNSTKVVHDQITVRFSTYFSKKVE